MDQIALHLPIYTRTPIQTGDKVVIKRTYKPAVPTAQEVRHLLELFPDFSPYKLALGFLAIQVMRPVELCSLQWQRFVLDKDIVTKFYHFVYKAGSEKTKRSTTHFFKEVEKPMLSTWLSHQLLNYQRIYRPGAMNKVFHWTSTDAMNKQLSMIRKAYKEGKISQKYAFLVDKTDDVVLGCASKTQYRICLYSLRRFSITFHYWVTFRQDIVALANFTGHSSPENLMRYYVKTKESIGLTDDMIGERITIDQFIHLHGENQRELAEYLPRERKVFLTPGQTSLSMFGQEDIKIT
jgi:integrase